MESIWHLVQKPPQNSVNLIAVKLLRNFPFLSQNLGVAPIPRRKTGGELRVWRSHAGQA